MKSNLTQALVCLVRELDIPITGNSIGEELEKHPNNPSLLAVSEVLRNWGVPNAAYYLSFKELIDTGMDMPFIAHLTSQGGEFVLVSQFDEKQVIVSNERWNKHRLSTDDFEKSYGGTILVAEKEAASGEADYKIKKRKELVNDLRVPIFILGTLILLVVYLVPNSSYLISLNWSIALLTLFKTAGLVVTIMLLIQSIDSNNPLIQRFCTGKNNDCDAILSSKSAKISEELSWSEVGFFYFAGTLLVLLFNNGRPGIMQVLSILNLISLPYTFYSIYYQWRIARQWCVFCCAVQGVLWLEFFGFFPYLFAKASLPGLREWSFVLICMAIPVLVWIFIKPYLVQAQKIQPLKQQLRTFKYNGELFNKMLGEQTKYRLPAEEYAITLGNREAENVVTVVSNPYCQPCAKTHKVLDEWLNSRPDLKLQMVFSGTDDEQDLRTQVVGHFIALQLSENEPALKHALNDWYDQKHKDYGSWSKKHPFLTDKPVNEALVMQREWCDLVDIITTPTIFINGRRLPKNYQPEDIKYFI